MKIPTVNLRILPLAGSLAIAASLFSTVPSLAGTSQALAQVPGNARQELPPAEELERRSCEYLREASTGTTHIRKQVRGVVGPGNSNTDFAVPAGTSFSSYIAMIIPENDAT